MAKITGITFYRFAYMGADETHYYGYDGDNDIIKRSVFYGDSIEYLNTDDMDDVKTFNAFINELKYDLWLFEWHRHYENHGVIDGVEWRITLHYKSGRTRSFSGVNAYPSDFDQFLSICKKYNFAQVYEHQFIDEPDLPWFDDFLTEVSQLEDSLVCPSCETLGLVHVNPFGYDFLCTTCGHEYAYELGKHSKEISEAENGKTS